MTALSYKDIYLKPKYSTVTSRSKVDTSVVFGGRTFKNPVMPANMVASIDEVQAKWLSENGYFYVMHRFFPEKRGLNGEVLTQTPFGFCHKAAEEKWKTISISIGVQKTDMITVENLAGWFGPLGREDPTRVDYITIDIAHGHCEAMKNMIKHIHDCFKHRMPDEPARPFIIAGNVTTPEAITDLIEWGADAIKVGIGGGGACSTKNKTGFHMPMFTAVKSCAYYATHKGKTVPIIADGGVTENADITKALVAGATMVMAGSIFAACEDSPAETIEKYFQTHFINDPRLGLESQVLSDGTKLSKMFKKTHFKKYFGSASAKNKGENKHVEGFEVELPCNYMTYAEKMKEITEDLQSSVSYAGGHNLSALKTVTVIEKG